MSRTFVTGASIVTRDEVLRDSTLVVEDGRVADIVPAAVGIAGTDDREVPVPDRLIVPGFIDVHVHGLLGTDVLDDAEAVTRVAASMPRWGVTAFAPTSIACPPDVLARFLESVAGARANPVPGSARVLGAHLESNFINPAYCGAQPLECLCAAGERTAAFSGAEVLSVIDAHRRAVGVVTLAPEMPGGLDLIRRFISQGLQVSLGHCGASLDEASAAFDAGASRATHLFSAMRPLAQRDPGVVGAALTRADVHVEMICDGVHAHPTTIALVMKAKAPTGFIAITDGTAASGLPRGTRTRLGWRPVTALDAARLDDGALAGSVATMDRVFRVLVQECGFDLVTAARLTSTNPAADQRLARCGILEPGMIADFVVLSRELAVESTWIAGARVWTAHPSDRTSGANSAGRIYPGWTA